MFLASFIPCGIMNPSMGWWGWAVVLAVGIRGGLGSAGRLCWVQGVEEFGMAGPSLWEEGPALLGLAPLGAMGMKRVLGNPVG